MCVLVKENTIKCSSRPFGLQIVPLMVLVGMMPPAGPP